MTCLEIGLGPDFDWLEGWGCQVSECVQVVDVFEEGALQGFTSVSLMLSRWGRAYTEDADCEGFHRWRERKSDLQSEQNL